MEEKLHFWSKSDSLRNELTAAETYRDKALGRWRDLVNAYTAAREAGRPKPDGGDAGTAGPIFNFAYSYVGRVLPSLVLENPVYRVSTCRPAAQTKVAQAIKHYLDKLSRDTDRRSLLRTAIADALFAEGVVHVRREPVPGARPVEIPQAARKGKPTKILVAHRPTAYHIQPDHFVRDQHAITWDDARFMGHKYARDIASIKADAEKEGWDVSWIEDSGGDVQALKRDARVSPARDEVMVYEVWVPEATPDDEAPEGGYHGTIYYLGVIAPRGKYDEERSGWIRPPRGWYGHRRGPYVGLQFLPVPGSSYGIAPLQASAEQVKRIDDMLRAAVASDEAYAKIILSDNEDLADTIASGEHQHVYAVEQLDLERVATFEKGGSTPQQWVAIGQQLDILERIVGLSEAGAGNPKGGVTATADAIAAQSLSVRMSDMVAQARAFAAEIAEREAWFAYHDDEIISPLGPDAAREMGMEPTVVVTEQGEVLAIPAEPVFYGGSHDEKSGATFDDLELAIEPYSMERTSEALEQQRAVQMVQFALQIAPVVGPQRMDWAWLARLFGDAMNVPGADRMFLGDVAGVGTPGEPQPRFSGELGRLGARQSTKAAAVPFSASGGPPPAVGGGQSVTMPQAGGM